MTNYYRLLSTWQRLQSFQKLSTKDIQMFHLRRFKTLIKHAYENVAMYRELYDSQSFDPYSIHDYKDIERVPPISKNFFRGFPVEQRIDRRVSEEKVLKESTSGSTGEPLEIWSDRTEGLIQAMKCVRFLKQWGYSIFDNTVQVWREVHMPKASVIQKYGILKRQYISFMDDFDIIIDSIKKSNADVLVSSRSSLEILANELQKRDVSISPKILVSCSEILTKNHRDLFRRVFGCETLNIYGCNEMGNIAYECPKISDSHNLHIDIETVIVNFRDIKLKSNGTKVGSIVVTNLENYVMPFIRYDLEDSIELPENNVCSCGRSNFVLGKVLGRNDDILDYNGRSYNWHFFYNYFKDYSYIDKYKIVQLRNGDIEFRVRLFEDSEATRSRCISELDSAFGKNIGHINLKFVHEFPKSPSGKFKVIEKQI